MAKLIKKILSYLSLLVISMLRTKLGLKMAKHRTNPWFDTLTCSHGLHQLINKPTHLLDSSSSCIDLIFTSLPNLDMESGVQSSFHPNCHHQLVFPKFVLSIYYPPAYEIRVLYYSRANSDLIWRTIDMLTGIGTTYQSCGQTSCYF